MSSSAIPLASLGEWHSPCPAPCRQGRGAAGRSVRDDVGFAGVQVAVIDRDVAVSSLPPSANLEVEPKMKWLAVGREVLGDVAVGRGRGAWVQRSRPCPGRVRRWGGGAGCRCSRLRSRASRSFGAAEGEGVEGGVGADSGRGEGRLSRSARWRGCRRSRCSSRLRHGSRDRGRGRCWSGRRRRGCRRRGRRRGARGAGGAGGLRVAAEGCLAATRSTRRHSRRCSARRRARRRGSRAAAPRRSAGGRGRWDRRPSPDRCYM